MPLMTKTQFIAHWLSSQDGDTPPNLFLLEEHYGEVKCQYDSERAMFGDAGPGQGLQVQSLARELHQVKSRLRSFGCNVR